MNCTSIIPLAARARADTATYNFKLLAAARRQQWAIKSHAVNSYDIRRLSLKHAPGGAVGPE